MGLFDKFNGLDDSAKHYTRRSPMNRLHMFVALLATLAAFPTVAQSNDDDSRTSYEKGESKVTLKPKTVRWSTLELGPDGSPYITMDAEIHSFPLTFYLPGTIGICMIAENEEMPNDPTKCHFNTYPSHKRNFIHIEKLGQGFTLKLGDTKYVSMKVASFVPRFKPEETPENFKWLRKDTTILIRGVPRRTTVATNIPAPTPIGAVICAWRGWRNCLPKAYGLAFPGDDSKQRYKVPMGEEIPIGNVYLLFGEDEKGPFVALRRYLPGVGVQIAYTNPLDIDKISSSWDVKYDGYDYTTEDPRSRGVRMAEARAPLIFGEGRQYKLIDECFAIQPLAKEGNDVVFNMRLRLTAESREKLAVADKRDMNERAGVKNAVISLGKRFYLHGFNFSWELTGAKATLNYEVQLDSIKSMEYAIVRQTAIAKIDPATLAFSGFAEGKDIHGSTTVDVGDTIVLKINGVRFVGISPAEVKDSGAVNGVKQQAISCDAKLWPKKPGQSELAKAAQAEIR